MRSEANGRGREEDGRGKRAADARTLNEHATEDAEDDEEGDEDEMEKKCAFRWFGFTRHRLHRFIQRSLQFGGQHVAEHA